LNEFAFAADDGVRLAGLCWMPETAPRGVVQIIHGMSEHARRYAGFAERLAREGCAVYAIDQRGFGASALGHLGHFADADGWNRVLADQRQLAQRLRGDHPGVPLFLFGHSMGSFIARAFLLRDGDLLAGLILSATGFRQARLARLLRWVASRQRAQKVPSRLMSRLVFGSFNLRFLPARTPFDWLTRDPAEVDAYIDSPWCGGECSPRLWQDLLSGIIELESAEDAGDGLPDIPVLQVAGTRDPVSLGGLGHKQLAQRYRRAGMHDLTTRLYPGGRHEMLNETNREEVFGDVVGWITEKGVGSLKKQAPTSLRGETADEH